LSRATYTKEDDCFLSDQSDCSEVGTHLTKAKNGAGITVPGSVSHQRFGLAYGSPAKSNRYDGWEPLPDENDPQREKTLGKGGQGVVYLARSPERAARLREADEQVKQILIQNISLQYDAAELAKCLVDLGGGDPKESFGALKHFQIPPDNKDEEVKAIGRLESEVKALHALREHPAVLKLMHDNVAQRFIVTEYHERGTLDMHLELFKGNVLAALEEFKPLIDAVCRIHKEGAIHRDIKPENIFVTASGSLVLGDFGIVFFQKGSDRLTTTYERVGSHEWMAPWAYKRKKLDISNINHTLDIFPLAKVLWSMIAGQNGFPFWEFERDENNLENLFPNDPFMSLVNKRLLSKRIVREENDCSGSAQDFLTEVENLINQLKISPGYKPNRASAWSCGVCGKGSYHSAGPKHQVKGFREGGPVLEQEIRLYVFACDHCGHAELFTRLPDVN
jgi:serine/threonine protein kinase